MPRRHISKEEKRLIVRMHARGASVQHLHDLTGVSIRAIQRAVQTQRETGDVVRTAPIIGRPRSLSGTDMAFLEACIERQPDLYLEELRELLDTTLGVQVSLDTIRRSLLRRGWTRKKVMRPARERDEHDRNLFQWLVGTYYDARHLVFVDESAYDRWTTRREYAWAPSGDRARRRDFFVRGTRFSMLPALCLDGIIHCNIIPGSVTSAIFNDFVSGLLHEMNPFPAPRSVIVMDNASIHKSNALREMVEARGMRLLFLPAYSPDFNPIEEAFSSIKSYIRHHRNYLQMEGGGGNDDPVPFLYEAVYSVTADDAEGWFRHSGYVA